MADTAVELNVSEFVAILNQTLEYAYPSVIIIGELANLRVSKNRWVYFDLKDDNSSVKFFGTVYQLPGPLEDGMLLKVSGQPRLHNLYGFSVNVQTIQPAGEGSIRKAQDLLRLKLEKEGLFDPVRKRLLPYPPQRIGLITSAESAAYTDFLKVLGARWGGLEVELADVQVQGEAAVGQIVEAVARFNSLSHPPEVLIIIRGGGSPEDLAAFSSEQVTRAVAASRIPTLVAIGHERDISLAELAADQRASTPSNAAELLVPDRRHVQQQLIDVGVRLGRAARTRLKLEADDLSRYQVAISETSQQSLRRLRRDLEGANQVLAVIDPAAVLQRGYAIVRQQGKTLRSAKQLQTGAIVEAQLAQGRFQATVDEVTTE